MHSPHSQHRCAPNCTFPAFKFLSFSIFPASMRAKLSDHATNDFWKFWDFLLHNIWIGYHNWRLKWILELWFSTFPDIIDVEGSQWRYLKASPDFVEYITHVFGMISDVLEAIWAKERACTFFQKTSRHEFIFSRKNNFRNGSI